MIPIEIEGGEALDRLSILAIKAEIYDSTENNNQLIDYYSHIRKYIANISDILKSEEYIQLKKINCEIFYTIEEIRRVEHLGDEYCSASWLDSLNSVRSKFRKEIQKKFFGSESKEFKT